MAAADVDLGAEEAEVDFELENAQEAAGALLLFARSAAAALDLQPVRAPLFQLTSDTLCASACSILRAGKRARAPALKCERRRVLEVLDDVP